MSTLKPSNTQTAVVLPRALKQRVEAHAEATGASVSGLVRVALTQYLAEQDQREKLLASITEK
ncbi:ribbon-helix-helix protein, CopG family [Paraburkholderia sediminicola]|uniref:ribbon-helix-helix domain-containing protein n=1 Tax=Paraburkholderia sediminicola TaxID=458836 RepID=UPI0038BB8C4C